MGIMEDQLIPWLIAQLDERGWSQRELGRRAGMSQTNISLVISGQQRPTFDFCAQVARALGMHPLELFQRAGLLPSSPAPVIEERQLLEHFRRLPAAVRQTALTILAALAGRPRAVADQTRPPYSPTGPDDDLLRQQVIDEFSNLPPEWQQVALEEIQRLQRYRTIPRVIGGEDPPGGGQ